MADIEFNCPSCKGHLVVDKTGAGEQVSCPHCNAPIVIPRRITIPEKKFTPLGTPSFSNQPPYQQTSNTAVWSLVLGILSFAGCFLLTGIPAIICGHVARGRIRESKGTEKGEGMAIAGLIMGYLSLIPSLILVLGLLGAIAIPSLSKQLETDSISTTRGTIKALDTAIDNYLLDHNAKLPNSLEDLMPYLKNVTYVPKDAWGNDFGYSPDHSTGVYKIVSPGKDGLPETDDDVTN